MRLQRFHKSVVAAAVLALSGAFVPTVSHAGPSVLSGVMRLIDGSPAANATGCLAILKSLTGGDSSPFVQFVTNDVGGFEVELPDVTQEMAQEAAFNGGTMNFELTGMANSLGRPMEDLTAEVVATGTTLLYDGVYAFAVPVTGLAEGTASAMLQMPNGIVLVLGDESNFAAYTAENPNTVAGEPSCGSSNDSPLGGGCYWTNWEELSRRAEPTVLGELHTYQDMWGHFIYSQSGSSSIGIAHKMENKAWNQTGEIWIGNTSSVSNSGVPYASMRGTKIEGNFNFVKEDRHRMCWGNMMTTQQRVRATVWNGDVFPGDDTSSYDGYYTYKDARDEGCARCGRFLKGQQFSRDGDKTKKYSVGAGPFGVTVSAQSTYNTTHRIKYSFGYNVSVHWLIGDDGPPSKAGIIWAY